MMGWTVCPSLFWNVAVADAVTTDLFAGIDELETAAFGTSYKVRYSSLSTSIR